MVISGRKTFSRGVSGVMADNGSFANATSLCTVFAHTVLAGGVASSYVFGWILLS